MTKIVREIITEVASLLGSLAYVEKVVKIGLLLLFGPSPGQSLQPSLNEGQGCTNNLPVGTSDQQITTQTLQQDYAKDNNASATPVGS